TNQRCGSRRQLQAQVRLARIDSHRHRASLVHALARALLGNRAALETNAPPRKTPRPRPDARARRPVCCRATNSTQRTTKEVAVAGAQPNGARLSCGAERERAQTQVYHNSGAPAASGAG